PRRTYGDYLESLIARWMSRDDAQIRLTVVQGECVDISEGPACVTVTLDDGVQQLGDVVVLATGNDGAASHLPCHVDPWASPSTAVDRDATVLILGTGLTMVDYVLSLLRKGHRGRIIATSRRGLLAKAHRRTAPLRIDTADVPFGATATALLRW